MKPRLFPLVAAPTLALGLVLPGAATASLPPLEASPSAAPASAVPARPALTIGSGRNSAQVGEYTVHYSAIPSTWLQPAIARQHAITRSTQRALLNVSVRRGARAASSVASAARVAATATNPDGQRQALRLREVRHRDAIYYLGEAHIDERDTLDFELVVMPVDSDRPIHARFRQEFWPATTVR